MFLNFFLPNGRDLLKVIVASDRLNNNLMLLKMLLIIWRGSLQIAQYRLDGCSWVVL